MLSLLLVGFGHFDIARVAWTRQLHADFTVMAQALHKIFAQVFRLLAHYLFSDNRMFMRSLYATPLAARSTFTLS